MGIKKHKRYTVKEAYELGLNVGDRVFTNASCSEKANNRELEPRRDGFHGTILCVHKGTNEICVKRDDGETGAGCAKSWKIYASNTAGFIEVLESAEVREEGNVLNKGVTTKIMNIFKKEPIKSLRKAGLMDGDDMPTDLGVKYFVAMMLQDPEAAKEFKEKVADPILEENKKKS